MKEKFIKMLCVTVCFIFLPNSGHQPRLFMTAYAAQLPQGLDDAEFKIEDGCLISYQGNDKKVTIPEGITSIGEKAFLYNKNTEELTMPESLTRLKDYALYGMERLQKITFRSMLKEIGEKAIGFYKETPYYTDPFGEDYTIELDWAENVKLYGPEDPVLKKYAQTYGFLYNDEMICKMKAKKLYFYKADKKTLRLYWDEQYLADGYNIYRSETKEGPFIKIGNKRQMIGLQNFYNDTSCEPGKLYYYQVKAYRKDESTNFTLVSENYIQGADKSGLAPTFVMVFPRNSSTLQLEWDPVKDADYYAIWRAENRKGPYKKAAVVKAGKKTAYIDKGLKIGKTYYYKVKAGCSKDKRIIGEASKVAEQLVRLSYFRSFQAARDRSGYSQLTWSMLADADGYYIYRKELQPDKSRYSRYKKIASIKDNRTLYYMDKKAKKGTQYKYCIKAYKKVGNRYYYSDPESVFAFED